MSEKITYTFPQKMKKITAIALPASANSLLDMFNMMVGFYFIAILSKDHIVAFNTSLNYVMLFFAVTSIFFMGTNAQISRYFGAKDMKKLGDALGSILIYALLLSLPLSVFVWTGAPKFFDWMGQGVTPSAKILGLEYMGVVALGMPALMAKTICISALTAIGNTKIIMYVKFFIITLNCFLNFVLINGADFGIFAFPRLEIFGAGLANTIVLYAEFAALFLIIFSGVAQIKFNFNLRIEYVRRMFSIGIPAGIERLLTLFSFVLVQKFMSSYGVDVIAGTQLGSRLENLILAFCFGFQVAAMSLVGQSLGRRRLDLAYSFARVCMQISLVIMGVLGVLMCIFGDWGARFFTSDSGVLQYCFYYILAVGLSQAPLALLFCVDGVLRGCGGTKLSLLINCSSIWIFRILPMSLCVWFEADVRLIFLCIFLETYIRAGIFYYVFRQKIWEKYIKVF